MCESSTSSIGLHGGVPDLITPADSLVPSSPASLGIRQSLRKTDRCPVTRGLVGDAAQLAEVSPELLATSAPSRQARHVIAAGTPRQARHAIVGI
mmetsp:Transcript_68920/g.224613  ORF Transcript_68920/g.224613 Transcript_68920/m.224613 type:complete len:95 (+) Transcript_68920:3336-3620(+)